jgi:hypothetical protein
MLHNEFYKVGTPYVYPSLSIDETEILSILSFVSYTSVILLKFTEIILSSDIEASYIIFGDITCIASSTPLLEYCNPGGK